MRAVAGGGPHGDVVRGGAFAVQQRAVGDGDDAGGGIDREGAAGVVVQRVGDGVGGVGVGGVGGDRDQGANRSIFRDRVNGGIDVDRCRNRIIRSGDGNRHDLRGRRAVAIIHRYCVIFDDTLARGQILRGSVVECVVPLHGTVGDVGSFADRVERKGAERSCVPGAGTKLAVWPSLTSASVKEIVPVALRKSPGSGVSGASSTTKPGLRSYGDRDRPIGATELHRHGGPAQRAVPELDRINEAVRQGLVRTQRVLVVP